MLRKNFVVETVTVPVIQNLNDTAYCQNITPFILEANVEDAVFAGPGVSNTMAGYLFDPNGRTRHI